MFSLGEMAALPDGMYVGSGAATAQKYPQGFPISVVDVPQVQQLDNTNPFDFPQGATTYPLPVSSANTQSRGPYREQLRIHYPSPTGSGTSVAYRMDTELPSSASAPPVSTSASTVTSTSTATKKFLSPASQMYMSDIAYQQQRWQQQQVQMMSGSDFYIQQSQNSTASSNSGVMMMPPTPTVQASQAQQQYYMPPPAAVPSHLHQHLQPQPPPQASHSRAYPALM